jgi:hypothetical protein
MLALDQLDEAQDRADQSSVVRPKPTPVSAWEGVAM